MTVAIAPRSELNEWVSCRRCRSLIYTKRLHRSLGVCPDCGYHARVDAHRRFAQLLDPGSIELLDLPVHSGDPLRFVDSKPYPQRFAEARRSTGLNHAVVCAAGTIEGNPLIVTVMDFRFMGGSLGGAVGELITRAGEIALERGIPLMIVTASGGARMQEGAVSLMQMAKTSQMLGQLDEAGILTISVITDPTFGGVAASFATLCDVIIAEPGARLGFAGPRVISQTIRQTLPEGFQTAEFLLSHGLIDAIRPRSELRATLARLLANGTKGKRDPLDAGEPAVITTVAQGQQHYTDPWEAVQRARHLDRPTTADYIGLLFDDFEELRGDRLGEDCSAIVGGLGRLAGTPVMVIGHQKGHTAAELAARKFGMPNPAGYRKAARLMRLAAKLGVPLITLVDTPGAYPGVEAERSGQAIAIAENLRLMAGLPIPVISVITGEGGSGGALALAVANRVLICANGIYSVISPEGCAAILWDDPAAAPKAAAALRLTSLELLRMGVVDGVVPEPDGGTQADHVTAALNLRAALVGQLRELLPLDPAGLIADRRARFRAFGTEQERQS
jgi:acetyl-CoA carboxylase carboxyl transferase beta subunit/acetyl-CoA carboxylase carboxyl transferase alpha subunit